MKKGLCLSALLAFFAACGGDGPPGTPKGRASLIIENDSQYVIEDVRVHLTEDYLSTPSLLLAPLSLRATILRHGSGSMYVSVMREKYSGGPMIALTTIDPIELLDGTGYRLIVFDESFRLKGDVYIPDPELPAQ
jgi:hypothetical protein